MFIIHFLLPNFNWSQTQIAAKIIYNIHFKILLSPDIFNIPKYITTMVADANIAAIRVKNGAKHPTYSPRVYAEKAKNANISKQTIT